MKKLFIIPAAAGIAGLWLFFRPADIPAATDSPPLEVAAIAAEVRQIPLVYRTFGTVAPLQEVVVRPQISGKLTQILFKEGDMVAQGDVIAKIDDATAKAELDKAQADLAASQAKLNEAAGNLQRYRKLKQSAVISQKAFEEQKFLHDRLKAEVQSNLALVEAAKIKCDHTLVAAPLAGRIGLRNVDEGNLVSASDAAGIATIVQTAPVTVTFAVPQQLFYQIKNPEETTVEVYDEAENLLDKGKVLSLDNAINSQNGTLTVKAMFANRTNRLLAGQFVNVHFIYGYNQDKVVLPDRIIRPRTKSSYVFKAIAGKVVVTPVETGYDDGQNSVVISGVKRGDIIITDDFTRLTDGMKVKTKLTDNQ